MVRVSFEGSDGSGKTRAVRALAVRGFPTIHFTDYTSTQSAKARIIGKWLGERAAAANMSGAKWRGRVSYFAHLCPYWMEWRQLKSNALVAADREPFVSFETHLHLTGIHLSVSRPVVKGLFKAVYGEPEVIFYLQVSAKTAMARVDGSQTHETQNDIENLVEILDETLERNNRYGNVITINNDMPRPWGNVMDEIMTNLDDRKLLGGLHTNNIANLL